MLLFKTYSGGIMFLSVLFSFPSVKTSAQNVGIGTATPQAKLDIKGNLRTGGLNNFLLYDSLSGKFNWNNSYIWAPNSQYLMKHSGTAEGLYYGNNQIEYRDPYGSPVFSSNWYTGYGYFSNRVGIGRLNPDYPLNFSDDLGEKICLYGGGGFSYGLGVQPFQLQIHTADQSGDVVFGSGMDPYFYETMRIKGNGRLGIGTTNPSSPLHIMQGSAGGTVPYGPLSVEGSTATYIGLLTPDNQESGIIFGKNSSNASGGIIYNNSSNLNGLQFRTHSNMTRMSITNSGNVGIGINNPVYKLEVSERMRVRSGGSNVTSAGIWFNNNTNIEAAFIGMEDDTHVGLFGNNGAGWKFGMNTQTGALKLNGSEGQAGQVIQSNGNAAAVWANPSNIIYNNMYVYNQTATETIPSNIGHYLPGISGTINLTSPSKVMISFYAYGKAIGCTFCGASTITTYAYVENASGGFVPQTDYVQLPNGATTALGRGFHIGTLAPGVYNIKALAQNTGPTIEVSGGFLYIVIIPQ